MIKRDRNEPEILRALRQLGADYLRLEPFDLLVFFRGRLFMLDVKTPEGRATKTQKDLIARGWPLHFVVTPLDALDALELQDALDRMPEEDP